MDLKKKYEYSAEEFIEVQEARLEKTRKLLMCFLFIFAAVILLMVVVPFTHLIGRPLNEYYIDLITKVAGCMSIGFVIVIAIRHFVFLDYMERRQAKLKEEHEEVFEHILAVHKRLNDEIEQRQPGLDLLPPPKYEDFTVRNFRNQRIKFGAYYAFCILLNLVIAFT